MPADDLRAEVPMSPCLGGLLDGLTLPTHFDRSTLRFLVVGESTDEWAHTYTRFGEGWRYVGITNREGTRRVN